MAIDATGQVPPMLTVVQQPKFWESVAHSPTSWCARVSGQARFSEQAD